MILSRPLALIALSLGLLLGATTDGATATQVQCPDLRQSTLSKQRAEEIRAAFKQSFNEYAQYAFGADEVKPLTKQRATSYGGWGATVVDALSTAHVMGHDDIFKRGSEYLATVDFTRTTQTDGAISLFETTIRFLGGLLSAYELGGARDKALLRQATVIGDRLLTGWVDGNDVPYNNLVNWNTAGRPDTSKDANIAEGGTLLLEFDRLSKYTGENKYRDHALRAMRAIINLPAPLPGLPGQNLRPSDLKPTSDYVTWGGGSDSYFEYLLKYAQLIGDDEGPWIPAWIRAVQGSIKHLITRAEGTREKLTYLSDYSASSGGALPRFSHLGCFAPGNWLLGAKLLGIDAVGKYGLELAHSCINTYTSSPSGIGPESFVYIGSGNNTRGITIKNAAFYKQHGFDFEVNQYILRPEVLESVFYAYRTTGDVAWQELAWDAWQSIKKHCKAPAAFAALANVDSASPRQLDNSQSFFYAETFKYLYLIFDDAKHISLDEYVFTTEAHLFRVDRPSKSYHAEWWGVPEPEQIKQAEEGHGPNDGKAQSFPPPPPGNGNKRPPTPPKEIMNEGSRGGGGATKEKTTPLFTPSSKDEDRIPVPKFSSLPAHTQMHDNTLGELMNALGAGSGRGEGVGHTRKQKRWRSANSGAGASFEGLAA